jgi:serine/threonine-protein kinase RsbW
MAKPRHEPITSINLLTTRTDRFTPVPYNEIEKLRNRAEQSGMMAVPAKIRIQMLGRLQHRDVALRSVSAACKLVSEHVQSAAWDEFRTHVVSAVSEAFNNIVLHGYAGRDDGIIELEIRTRPDRIAIELRDWGESFDPTAVPTPDFDSLPESGLGFYIIQAFMNIRYRPGNPNVLVLSKELEVSSEGEA